MKTPTKEQIEKVADAMYESTHPYSYKGKIKYEIPLSPTQIRFLRYAETAINTWEKIRS